ncbi:MAG: hypothetical protein WD846_04055 [Patescibacteria group bacterium]
MKRKLQWSRAYQRLRGYKKIPSLQVPDVLVVDPLYVLDPITPKVLCFLRKEWKWLAGFSLALFSLALN